MPTGIPDEVHHVTSKLGFSMYSAEEMRKLSRCQVTCSMSTNDLGQPLPGGLYDLHMGPYMREQGICSSCQLRFLHCPGHMGHIELVLPVINPMFRSVVVKLLARTCLQCSALLYPSPILVLNSVQLSLLDMGLAHEALQVAESVPQSTGRPAAAGSTADLEIDLEDCAVSTKQLTDKLFNYLADVKQAHAEGRVVSEVRSVWQERRAIIHRFLLYKPLKKCPMCNFAQPTLTDYNGQIVRVNSLARKAEDRRAAMEDPKGYVTASEAREVLRKLWKRESALLLQVFGMLQSLKTSEHPTDAFFMELLPVTAPRFRPMNMANGKAVDHTQSVMYSSIFETDQLLRKLVALRKTGGAIEDLPADQQRLINDIKGASIDEKMLRCWRNLQCLVDLVLDSEMNKSFMRRTSIKNMRGVKQVLEKKEGLFRMNMMGKRVDFAGRTVITPDPYLSVEELGVPDVMATKLSYPQPVTPQNVHELQRAVLNGPNRHPGASAVTMSGGTKVVLRDDRQQLRALAGSLLTPPDNTQDKMYMPKIVHRHLVTGDCVLLNRQPTLHRPSIMAHRVRVLPGEKTFRLHYSNCKSYNADFDGDEMNIHLPQGEEARSEAFGLMFSPHNYLVPKDGTPLGGLIQDHVVAGVRLSMRGTFFERSRYQQLVACGLAHHRRAVKLLPPAILKPRPLWTGKQVLSTIIVNLTPPGRPAINLRSKAKLNAKIWQRQPPRAFTAGGTITEPELSESEVVIRGGHLLCGVLDKQQFGAVPFSLVHGFFELYGGAASSNLLSAFSRLFTCHLHWMGFTLGVRDILVTAPADRERDKVISQLEQLGAAAAADALGPLSVEERGSPEAMKRRLEERHLADTVKSAHELDRAYKARLDTISNGVTKACLPVGLVLKFPENNLQLMVESGAKGSKVNTMQISCLLGQIELEGRRPPRMVSGKTLPSFAPYELAPRAGGFVAGRFMTGIRPQEYFFHCMAGREGLIDTAVKTSRTGYLQRCLIKHLEGLVVNYDCTVRDSDGSLIQFRYGEDGCETQKVPYLTAAQLSFFDDNHSGMVDSNVVEEFKRRSNIDAVLKRKKKIKKWRRKFGDPRLHRRCSPFLEFTRTNPVEATVNAIDHQTHRPVTYATQLNRWMHIELEQRAELCHVTRRCPDPVDSVWAPDAHFSSVCERLDAMIADYLQARPGGVSRELADMLYLKVARAMVQPGEAVGLVAGQSIGEPSTQMTLNTFHFAGRGDMNVTLGIPRLREILSASKQLKTPSMEMPVRAEAAGGASAAAHRLRLQLTRVTLAQVLRQITVAEHCTRAGNMRVYRLRLQFLPRSAYKSDLSVTPASVLQYVETVWVRRLLKLLAKTFQLKDSNSSLGKDKSGSDLNTTFGDVDDPAGGGGDADDPAGGGGDDPAAAAASGEKPPPVDGEAGDDSDAEIIEGDGDATDARERNRRTDGAEYESEDEQEADDELGDGADDADDGDNVAAKMSVSVDADSRRSLVRAQTAGICQVKQYDFDVKRQLWCQITIAVDTSRQCDLQTLVTEDARSAVIRQVAGIARAFVIEDSRTGQVKLCTEGINLAYMARYSDILHLNQMYCNDLHCMANTYGIETATTCIVKEISAVFSVYGIEVSPRHLSLVADYMTHGGGVRGFNRGAMDAVVSPLQQMSFETTIQFLRKAVLAGQVDELKSPSARLVVGQPYVAGTGMFSLLHRLVPDAPV